MEELLTPRESAIQRHTSMSSW